MKALQVTTDPDRRGAQIFAAALAPVLWQHGIETRTVALAPGAGGDGLGFPVLGNTRLGWRTLSALRDEVRKRDVVVGFGSSTLPACAIASPALSTPFIYRSIGDLRYWAPDLGRRTRVRLALSRATAVVTLWPEAAATLTDRFGVPPSRVRVIPRGVDPDHFAPSGAEGARRARQVLGLPLSAPVAACVGSLAPEKALDDAIQAAAQVPDLILIIAGSGPAESALRSLAGRVAPGRVHFLGPMRDTRPVYAACDLLVLSSRSEGVPGVVIEAGMSARPAVATAVGGTPSIIDNGVTGRLVRPSDPQAMTQAIEEVLAAHSDLGAHARERYAQRFSLAAVGRSWVDLLSEVTR